MARKARVEFEGAVYHILDRGDRREAIFKDDADRRRFLGTLGEACARKGVGRIFLCGKGSYSSGPGALLRVMPRQTRIEFAYLGMGSVCES